jgi:RNA polymerase sigma-70 factor (ECF subfamily)
VWSDFLLKEKLGLLPAMMVALRDGFQKPSGPKQPLIGKTNRPQNNVFAWEDACLRKIQKSRGDPSGRRDFLFVAPVKSSKLASEMSNHSTIDWPAELQQHQSWLKNVLRSRIGDAHAAEDVLQELIVVVLRQLKTLNHPTEEDRRRSTLPTDRQKVAPWLYRVAIRHAVNYHRKQNRRSQAKPVAEIEVISSDASPLDWMLNRESNQNLQHALKQLSHGQHEILMLKFAENWSYQQMADHLGISVRAVEHRLLKARKQLRSILVGATQSQTQSPRDHGAADVTR